MNYTFSTSISEQVISNSEKVSLNSEKASFVSEKAEYISEEVNYISEKVKMVSEVTLNPEKNNFTSEIHYLIFKNVIYMILEIQHDVMFKNKLFVTPVLYRKVTESSLVTCEINFSRIFLSTLILHT